MASTRRKQTGASTSKRTAGARSGAKGRAKVVRSPRSPSARSAKAPARSSSRRTAVWSWAVVAAVAVLAWTYYPALRVQYQEQKQRARLESELEGLKERNDRLRAQVDRLKTPEGVEDAARESLGLVKAGEHAYVVMDTTETPTTADPDRHVVTTDTAWTQLLDALFGVKD